MAAQTLLDLDQIHTVRVACSSQKGEVSDHGARSGTLKKGLVMPCRNSIPATSQGLLCKSSSTESISSVMPVKDMVLGLSNPQKDLCTSPAHQGISSNTPESFDEAVLGLLQPLAATTSIKLPDRFDNEPRGIAHTAVRAPLPLQRDSKLGGGWHLRQAVRESSQNDGFFDWLDNKPPVGSAAATISAEGRIVPSSEISSYSPQLANRTSLRSMKGQKLRRLGRKCLREAAWKQMRGNHGNADSPISQVSIDLLPDSVSAALQRNVLNETGASSSSPAPKPTATKPHGSRATCGAPNTVQNAKLSKSTCASKPVPEKTSMSAKLLWALQREDKLPRRRHGQALRLQAMIAGPSPPGRKVGRNTMPPLLPAGSSSKFHANHGLLIAEGKDPPEVHESPNVQESILDIHEDVLDEVEQLFSIAMDTDAEDLSSLSDDESEMEIIAIGDDIPLQGDAAECTGFQPRRSRTSHSEEILHFDISGNKCEPEMLDLLAHVDETSIVMPSSPYYEDANVSPRNSTSLHVLEGSMEIMASKDYNSETRSTAAEISDQSELLAVPQTCHEDVLLQQSPSDPSESDPSLSEADFPIPTSKLENQLAVDQRLASHSTLSPSSQFKQSMKAVSSPQRPTNSPPPRQRSSCPSFLKFKRSSSNIAANASALCPQQLESYSSRLYAEARSSESASYADIVINGTHSISKEANTNTLIMASASTGSTRSFTLDSNLPQDDKAASSLFFPAINADEALHRLQRGRSSGNLPASHLPCPLNSISTRCPRSEHGQRAKLVRSFTCSSALGHSTLISEYADLKLPQIQHLRNPRKSPSTDCLKQNGQG